MVATVAPDEVDHDLGRKKWEGANSHPRQKKNKKKKSCASQAFGRRRGRKFWGWQDRTTLPTGDLCPLSGLFLRRFLYAFLPALLLLLDVSAAEIAAIVMPFGLRSPSELGKVYLNYHLLLIAMTAPPAPRARAQ